MFISKLGFPGSRGNYSLTSKCRFKSPKIHELCNGLEFKTRASTVFLFPLSLADLDKKYRNEKLKRIKNNGGTYMEYDFFLNLGVQNVEEIIPLLPSADSKTLKSMNCITSSSSKPVPVAFYSWLT